MAEEALKSAIPQEQLLAKLEAGQGGEKITLSRVEYFAYILHFGEVTDEPFLADGWSVYSWGGTPVVWDKEPIDAEVPQEAGHL